MACTFRPIRTALLIAGLCVVLEGCQRSETGPEEQATTAAAPLVAPSLPAVTSAPEVARPLAGFDGRDTDHDGRVTSAEYAKASQSMFEMMDLDHDGTVSLHELDAARAALGEQGSIKVPQLIALGDSDGDGKLTLAEWMAASNARFDAIDTGNDDVIDRGEWDAAAKVGQTQGPPPGNSPAY